MYKRQVQYNAEDDGTTDLLFAIAAPEKGSLHVDMLARMMQMLMNEDFVEKLKAAKTPKAVSYTHLDVYKRQEEAVGSNPAAPTKKTSAHLCTGLFLLLRANRL